MINTSMHPVYLLLIRLYETFVTNKVDSFSDQKIEDFSRLQFLRNSNRKSSAKADDRGVFSSLRYQYIHCVACASKETEPAEDLKIWEGSQ